MSQKYSKSYFQIQAAFAEKVAEVTELAFEDALLKYTVVSKGGINWGGMPCDRRNRFWVNFLQGLKHSSSKHEFIHEFYLNHTQEANPSNRRFFGCFSYAYPWRGTNKVAIHFVGQRNNGPGALAKPNAQKRRGELKRLFEDVGDRHPDAERVRGNSWMHNIESYRRLFPRGYYDGAKEVPIVNELKYEAIWGQFVDFQWKVRSDLEKEFTECLQKQTTFDGCLSCFRYQTINPECPSEIFYDFYGIA